ncbi:PadR family transcriptional regulator [Candidatus Saccharibacteria bacterium]|nr:PadR family transcriptional regulator [Candidatus Saccharibacteria bacterium]
MDTKVTESENAANYASELTVQLKKGLLTQCVLQVAEKPIYASEILAKLDKAGLNIVEGTIYPLLSRLSRDKLLKHEWQESTLGPPRKYYQITDYGREVRTHLGKSIDKLNKVINVLAQPMPKRSGGSLVVSPNSLRTNDLQPTKNERKKK